MLERKWRQVKIWKRIANRRTTTREKRKSMEGSEFHVVQRGVKTKKENWLFTRFYIVK